MKTSKEHQAARTYGPPNGDDDVCGIYGCDRAAVKRTPRCTEHLVSDVSTPERSMNKLNSGSEPTAKDLAWCLRRAELPGCPQEAADAIRWLVNHMEANRILLGSLMREKAARSESSLDGSKVLEHRPDTRYEVGDLVRGPALNGGEDPTLAEARRLLASLYSVHESGTLVRTDDGRAALHEEEQLWELIQAQSGRHGGGDRLSALESVAEEAWDLIGWHEEHGLVADWNTDGKRALARLHDALGRLPKQRLARDQHPPDVEAEIDRLETKAHLVTALRNLNVDPVLRATILGEVDRLAKDRTKP